MSLAPDPLAAAEASARLVEATSTMRHDVRNKLAAIKNAAFYLKRKSEPTPLWTADKRVPTFFGLIDSELAAADELTGDLAGPSTLFERTVRPVDPFSCVERAVALARVDPGVKLETALGAGASLHADPDELAVGVRCLVENAAEAAPPGSVVSVRAVLEPDRVIIEVTDQGSGVPPDLAVFRPFVTRRPGHAGLGLPIALRVAKKHGGAVAFVEGMRGTCVRMTLLLGV